MIFSSLFTKVSQLFAQILPGQFGQIITQIFTPIIDALKGLGL